MRTVIKPVYYCDFCNKRYLAKNWATRHERHCTANINRVCRTCKSLGLEQPDYAELIKYFGQQISVLEHTEEDYSWLSVKAKPTLDDIRDAANGCPACMLTVMRLTQSGGLSLCHPAFEYHWKFKVETVSAWADYNADLRRNEMY